MIAHLGDSVPKFSKGLVNRADFASANKEIIAKATEEKVIYIAKGQANLSSDDRTMLRVFISEHYPNIEGEEAEEWVSARIKTVIECRRLLPWGYNDVFSLNLIGFLTDKDKQQLVALNDKGKTSVLKAKASRTSG